jgi:hypothetical protein
MAYISQEEKKNLMPEISRVLKKYGMKGSIAIRHGSTLVVTLPTGKLDLIGNWFDMVKQNHPERIPDKYEMPTCMELSHHWLDSKFSGECLEFLTELFDAMKGPEWFDDSDLMTDYFHVAHYVDVKVGRWNKPYILEA